MDRNSQLFQNLNGEISDVEIRFNQGSNIVDNPKNADAFLFNKITQTYPIIVHGNGASKIPLNSLGNYLAKSWHPAIGCISCDENEQRINLDHIDHDDYPHVLMAITILKPTPFFPEFLEYLTSLDYYKHRITLFIQSTNDYHNEQIDELMENFRNYYHDIRYVENKQAKEWQLRNNYL